jgi:hypothetical protein
MTSDHADLRRALQSAYDFGSDYPHPRLLAAISAEIGKGQERRTPGWLFGATAAAVLAVLIVTVFLLIPRSGQPAQRAATPSPSFPSNLPPGVCAPTVEQLKDPGATRIEAKLVTRETLSKSDPNFSSGFRTAVKYFWVVAKLGVFNIEPIGPPPGSHFTPTPFHFVLSYILATSDPSDQGMHPCSAVGITANGGPWPTWFDQMKALADVKIK